MNEEILQSFLYEKEAMEFINKSIFKKEQDQFSNDEPKFEPQNGHCEDLSKEKQYEK